MNSFLPNQPNRSCYGPEIQILYVNMQLSVFKSTLERVSNPVYCCINGNYHNSAINIILRPGVILRSHEPQYSILARYSLAQYNKIFGVNTCYTISYCTISMVKRTMQYSIARPRKCSVIRQANFSQYHKPCQQTLTAVASTWTQ